MSRRPRKMKGKEFSEALFVYMEKNPNRCDVTFLVGDEKEVVRSLRAVLEVSSPVFTKLFAQHWDPLLAKPEADDDRDSPVRGIVIPDLHPVAFKIFHKLLFSHEVSTEVLLSFNMSAELLLNVMHVSSRFPIRSIEHQLNVLAEQSLFSDLTRFIQTEEFMFLSQRNVNTILSRDEISMEEADIFDVACKWAEVQCSECGLDSSVENVRTTLGDALFQIRFPIMSYKDFGRIIRTRNILTPEEQIDIFKHISMDEPATESYNGGNLRFITRKRSMVFGPTVTLLKYFRSVKFPPFRCDGQACVNYLQVDQRVMVTSFGFLGPIERDAWYECEIEILRYYNSNYSSQSVGKVERKVFAKKKQIFHVKLEKPVALDATHTNESIWKDYYGLRFSLKGPRTECLELSVDGVKKATHRFRAVAESVAFNCQWSSCPLVEMQFRKS